MKAARMAPPIKEIRGSRRRRWSSMPGGINSMQRYSAPRPPRKAMLR
jgi:hypothetical protein